jgi:hypothetical protein
MGWMKSKVYIRKLDTRDKLLNHKMDAITDIKELQDALRKTVTSAHAPSYYARALLSSPFPLLLFLPQPA